MATGSRKLTGRLAKAIGFLSGAEAPLAELTDGVLTASPTTLSARERARMISRVAAGNDPLMEQASNGDGLLTLLQSVTRDVAAAKITNEQVEAIAPEIVQAAAIMIPLIMAPNDLRHDKVAITATHPGLSEEQRRRISALVTEHADRELQLSERLPGRIKKALYGAGAACTLMVPLSELDRQFNSKDHIISTEGLIATLIDERAAAQSLFGICSGPGSKEVSLAAEEIAISIEGLFDPLRPEAHAAAEAAGKKPSSYDRHATTQKTTEMAALAQRFIAHENLVILDDPNVVKIDQLARKRAQTKMAGKLASHFGGAQPKPTNYAQQALVSLSVPDGKDAIGNPMVMELPPESVVPLFPPGSPHDHIGYFIVLDELGNPINITQSMYRDAVLPNAEREQFQKLFQAYGVGELTPIYGQHQQLMGGVYQRVVEAYLKAKLGAAGLSNVDIGTDNAVFQCMFTRYLRQRRTRLLFVPKELLSYFCFRYNDNGTGRSKLEDLKFILSLRITLLMCRTMSAINNAIDRRKITATLPAGFRGNALQFVADLQREAVRKAVVTPSLDPDEITRSVTSKSMTIKVNNMPGAQDFSIDNEANERTSATPDEQLTTDITNLLINGLDLTPSMMNMLSDAEYARSVTTTNIMLSRKIVRHQEITCRHTDHHVQGYVSYSKPLRDQISAILAGKEMGKGEEAGTVATEDKQDKVALDEVIASLRTTLPRPTIAPDKAQFESLEGFMQTLDTLLQNIYNDDLANNDQEAGEAMQMMRGWTKMQAIRTYLENVGFASHLKLPNLDEMVGEVTSATAMRQALLNIKGALEMGKSVARPQADGMMGGMGGGMGDAGMGGGPGMSEGGDMGGDLGSGATGGGMDSALPAAGPEEGEAGADGAAEDPAPQE